MEKSYQRTYMIKILVFLFFSIFIFNQFFSIYFRWYNHQGIVGLDDADYYISRIAYYKNHSLFEKSELLRHAGQYLDKSEESFEDIRWYFLFNGVLSSFVLGKLSAFLDISAEKIFFINFYIGIFLVGLILFVLLKEWGIYPLNVIVGLTFFSFYTGKGSYHGFFWIVPSFYCSMLWLLTTWVFYFNKHWKISGPVVLWLLMFSHALSLYSICVICFSLILTGLLEKDTIPLKKSAYMVLYSVIFFGIYKILLHKGLILPFFTEGFATSRMISFNLVALKEIWNVTPFKHYFFGPFLPLTLGGIVYSYIRKEYKLLSLFIAAVSGTIAFSCIHLRGMRTFLFLEIVLVFLIIYGIHSAILVIWSHRHFPKNKVILSLNCIMIFIAFGYGLFLFKSRMAQDFCHKFKSQRVWQKELTDSFIQNKNPKTIFYIGSIYRAFALLSLDGYWDKKIYTPYCMLSSDKLSNAMFIGENYSLYRPSRQGIGIFWPQTGRIALKLHHKLVPGDYSISILAASLTPKMLNQITVEIDDNKKFQNISKKWNTEPLTIMHSLKNVYPPLMPPWYFLMTKYIETIRRDFITVRETFLYTMDFSISQPTDTIYLHNHKTNLNIIGKINIFSTSDNNPFFSLDLDSEKVELIDAKAQLYFQGNIHPLLWKDPRYNVLSPYVFKLVRNFGDIKIFKIFSD